MSVTTSRKQLVTDVWKIAISGTEGFKRVCMHVLQNFYSDICCQRWYLVKINLVCSSLPPIFPAIVCLHLYIVGSVVHSNWLNFHLTSLSLSRYHSYHLISSAIWPTIYCSIVSENKPPSSWVFTIAWSPHSSSLSLSHLVSCEEIDIVRCRLQRWATNKNQTNELNSLSLLSLSLSLTHTHTHTHTHCKQNSWWLALCYFAGWPPRN